MMRTDEQIIADIKQEREKRRQQREPSTEVYMAKKATFASNVGNALTALEREPEIANAFGYDEMQRTEMLLRPLFGDDPNFKPRPVTDADVIVVQKWLQSFGFRQLGKDVAHDAINKHARDHVFHPVRDHLDGLRWDGTGRVHSWLTDYLGVEQSEYVEAVG